MLLFALWTLLALAALAGAGYSHYRYRVTRNRYYEHRFAKDPREPIAVAHECNIQRSTLLPVLTLGLVTVLVPMSLLIGA